VPRRRHRTGLVFHQDVDHAVAVLHAAGADLLGLEDAQPAAFDHGRAAHADVAAARGDDHVAAAQQRRVARETAAADDADHRHLPRQPGVAGEGADVQAGHDGHVGVAGTPAATFGEQNHRQLLIQRDAQHAVGLGMVAHALRAGQHGRVVGHDHRATGFGAMDQAIDAADAGHHAVSWRVAHQVVLAAPAALGGHGQRAVFDEAALVAQIRDVFAGRALAQGVAPGDGFGAAGVQGERVAVHHALQVRAKGGSGRLGLGGGLRAAAPRI